MSDTSRQEDIEKFIRQSLLGVELVNTQFHLFSSKSVSSRRVTTPRILAANDTLLTKNSRFFSELLGSPTRSSDPALVDIRGIDEVPDVIEIDDYGYGSDSDLDDEEPPTSSTKNGKQEPATKSKISSRNLPRVKPANGDEGSSEGDSESFASDILDFDLETSIRSSSAPVHRGALSSSDFITRLGTAGSRHILMKDTAFQTLYSLLNYLCLGKVAFSPLKSAGMQSRTSSTSHIDEPRCSPKSMYRLACKVDLEDLRDEAMAAIYCDLTEHNILTELAHSLLSSHPPLLEMELDVLYSHIASPPVVTNLPDLARRIANREFRHGASIITGIHSRLLQQHPIFPPLAPRLNPAAGPASTSAFTSEGETEPSGEEILSDYPASPPAVDSPLPVRISFRGSFQASQEGSDEPRSENDLIEDDGFQSKKGKKGKKGGLVGAARGGRKVQWADLWMPQEGTSNTLRDSDF